MEIEKKYKKRQLMSWLRLYCTHSDHWVYIVIIYVLIINFTNFIIVGRMGGTLAPWVGKLSMYHPYLPVAIFGINAIIGNYV